MSLIRHALRWFVAIVLAITPVIQSPVVVQAADRSASGTFPIVDNFVDPGASAACGFPVSAALTGLGRYEIHFDASGNPTSLSLQLRRTGTMSGNGVTLSEFDQDNHFIDLQSGTDREVGIVFRVSTLLGAPAIFDRGRIIFDGDGTLTFEAGPHPALDGNFSGLCAALGA